MQYLPRGLWQWHSRQLRKAVIAQISRSLSSEKLGGSLTVCGGTSEQQWMLKVFVDLVFWQRWQLNAAGLDLGLFLKTKAIDWRRRLVLGWFRLVRQRLERWPCGVVAQLLWASFGFFSSDWWLFWQWISTWVCWRYWGEFGGSVNVGGNGLGLPDRGQEDGNLQILHSSSRLLQQGGEAWVERGIYRLQFWHPNLVCNGVGWLAAGPKVGLFHLFPAHNKIPTLLGFFGGGY